MRFGSGLIFVYDETWEFIRRAWWVALMPSAPLVAAFFVLSDAPSQPLWQTAAFWCVLALTAVLQAALPYCVIRFLALKHDLAGALSVNRASARTYAPYLAALTAFNLVGLIGASYGRSFTVAFALASLALFPLLSLWTVTAPSGATVIGPLRSARTALPHLPWALAFLITAFVPLGLLQAAAGAALGRLAHPLTDPSNSAAIQATETVFNAAAELLFIVAQFVVAQKAGMRVGADRSVAAVFD
jgi:hypothetical protein